VVITGAGPKEIRVKHGSYRVPAVKDGKVIKKELVSISRGSKQIVRVSVESTRAGPAATQARLAPEEKKVIIGL
jgi:hypothetical protein